MNNNNLSGLYSWPVIILALIFFWPVGLFLIFKRSTLDKRTAMSSSGKGLKGLGIGLTVFGAIGFIGFVGDSDGNAAGGIIVTLFFIAGGIALIMKSKKIIKEAESVKQYLNMIVNCGERKIDAIAAATGKPYNIVKNDIQQMINKDFLKNAYINENTREVVLMTDTPTYENGNVQRRATTKTASQTRIVACPCCGANNTISGTFGECEYCGTALQ